MASFEDIVLCPDWKQNPQEEVDRQAIILYQMEHNKKIFDPSAGIPHEWKDVILGYSGLECIGPVPTGDKDELIILKNRVELVMTKLGAYFSPFYLDELEI